mmetsp:Transcript_29448/g.47016  ORF Transcript_29448/g.47016 Transcript_29448/m.47016 type:complete len:298 (-) Transcript_29448:529-1422(-)
MLATADGLTKRTSSSRTMRVWWRRRITLMLSRDIPSVLRIRRLTRLAEMGSVTTLPSPTGVISLVLQSHIVLWLRAWYLTRSSLRMKFRPSNPNPNPNPNPNCSKRCLDSHNYACYGGWPDKAYEFLKNYEGLVEEKDYPYVVEGHTICLANQTFNETCGDGICDDPPLTNWCDLTCSSKPHSSLVARVVSYEELPSDEKKMARFLEENGPVSVAIDAGDLISWLQFYKSGIADPWCSKTQLNHAVLLVGYGSENGKAYWVVKNSWGADFGEQGYFRLIMGKGACGLNTKPVIPHAV